jgi:ATP-dependent DNA helicase HFM1/MER3
MNRSFRYRDEELGGHSSKGYLNDYDLCAGVSNPDSTFLTVDLPCDSEISMRTIFPDQWAKMQGSALKTTSLHVSGSYDYLDDEIDLEECHDPLELEPEGLVVPSIPSCENNGGQQSFLSERREFVSNRVTEPQCLSTKLVSTRAICDSKIESLFKFDYFNAVQSECFQALLNSDRNILVSAPTGAGKTCLLELAIVRLMKCNKDPNVKIVYIGPTKALCDERVRDWQKFTKLGYSCSALTGDSPKSQLGYIQKSNILVTTPEKWDSVTRQWVDSRFLLRCVHLLLVDEIHTLKDGSRGATLEVVITRMRTLYRVDRSFPNLRVVAVSATVPNLEDFSAWLRDSQGNPAVMKTFGEEYRPVQLERHVLSYPTNTNPFAFEDNLKYKLPEVIQKYSQGKPALIFCSTRKSTSQTAEFLVKSASELKCSSASSAHLLQRESRKFTDKKLASLVAEGVGYHHAGLDIQDRRIIEELFLNGLLPVICTTSTLAVGVNLPARLVVIKGTSQYDFNAGKMKEYSDHDIFQMMGRAGRPQYDQFGVAVIMTTITRKDYFENLLTGKTLIESSLHESLIEHLNAEIVLGTTSNRESAMDWLTSTFLYSISP